MTSWLKWRLYALFGASLLAISGTYLSAQNAYPAPAKTPEAASQQFLKLLSAGIDQNNPYADSYFSWLRAKTYIGSVSRQQLQSMPNIEPGEGPQRLFFLLAREFKQPQFAANIQENTGSDTIVTVSPATRLKNREVVVLAEDGGYRVDLKATFARWNNLSGKQLEEKWFGYTGIASAALAQDGVLLRSLCQSQMKQQMLGIMQYVQDYDERLPPARSWMHAVQPYMRSEQLYQCPTPPNKGYGYAYNQHLSQLLQSRIESSFLVVNIYETSNPRYNCFGPGTGRAFRHLDGWNLAFADGHVKWFPREGPHNFFKFAPKLK